MAYEVTVDGITISSNEELSEKECRAYIHYIQSKNHNRNIERINLDFEGDDVNLGYYLEPQGFEKIRRITVRKSSILSIIFDPETASAVFLYSSDRFLLQSYERD